MVIVVGVRQWPYFGWKNHHVGSHENVLLSPNRCSQYLQSLVKYGVD